MNRIFSFALFMVMVCILGGTDITTEAGESEQSLVSFSSGALLVQKPSEYGPAWSAFWILDERPESGWASPKGKIENNIFVIELAERTLLRKLEFDTGSIDGEGRGAKDVLVEVSDEGSGGGFKKIAEVSLADKADGQSFSVTEEVPGRWVRLTIKNNHGAPDYTELMEFCGYELVRN